MKKATKTAKKPRPKTPKPVMSWRRVNTQTGWISLEMSEDSAKERASLYGGSYRAARVSITYEVLR